MIVGTAGHVDHGKTALVHALTGVDTDRLQEEKARGMTIDLGFAYLSSPGGDIVGFIDVPGHERFVHTMLAGAGGIDFVLLVVAADDGVMPQTREHLAIMDLLDVRRGMVVLSKADLADAGRRSIVTAEVRTALAGTALADVDVVPASVITGEGIDELRRKLCEAATRSADHSASGRFRLAVDRSFTLRGIGTVVTGTVLSGSVGVGDNAVVSPAGLAVRVRSIHAQNQLADRGRAGDRCALNLTGDDVSKDAIRRGDIVLDPALHAPTDRIDVELRVLAGEPKPIGHWFPARLHHFAAEVGARIVLLGSEPLAPGDGAKVQLVLDSAIAAAVGDPFVIRDTSAQRTVGGGRFVDLRAPARKRGTPQRLAQLEACAIPTADEAVDALLKMPPYHIDLTAFARDRALGETEADGLIGHLGLISIPVGTALFALSPARWVQFQRDVNAALERFHVENPDMTGMGMEKLRLALEPRFTAPLFSAALRGLVRAGGIVLDGAWVRLSTHEAHLAPGEEALWLAVEPLLNGTERLHPPRVRDIAGMLARPEGDTRKLLKVAGRMGRVHEVAHDHFFLRSALSDIVGIVCDLTATEPGGEFNAAQFRDRVGSGRKVAIHILEFMDRHGITMRRGDMRRVNRHRLDLFRDADHN